MAEVFVNSHDVVSTKIFYAGNIVDADGEVQAHVHDITEDISIVPPVDPSVPVLILTALKDETNIGSYSITIPSYINNREKKLLIEWSYFIDGEVVEHTTLVDVVKPYCSFGEAINDLNIGTDPSDPNYKSYNDLKLAEKYARNIIEDFTGQEFYLYEDEIVVYGVDSDILPLQYKINNIHKIYANDILLVDYVSHINNWGYSPIISESGFGIRLDKTTLLDNTVYIANGMVPPTVNDLYAGQAFRDGVRYRIKGKFGWDRVPSQVQDAAIQLMGHYFAKDRIWADRYLKNISTFDWDFEYSDEVYKGTGCAYADKILSDYVIDTVMLL
ncbi:MAG: hypothetical protein ACO3DP_01220 [Candidatus Nanopelagicaceae bacterium]